ncbi:MAG: hypothetical protein QXY05_02300 [Candidatus Anstonellales archaeon]
MRRIASVGSDAAWRYLLSFESCSYVELRDKIFPKFFGIEPIYFHYDDQKFRKMFENELKKRSIQYDTYYDGWRRYIYLESKHKYHKIYVYGGREVIVNALLLALDNYREHIHEQKVSCGKRTGFGITYLYYDLSVAKSLFELFRKNGYAAFLGTDYFFCTYHLILSKLLEEAKSRNIHPRDITQINCEGTHLKEDVLSEIISLTELNFSPQYIFHPFSDYALQTTGTPPPHVFNPYILLGPPLLSFIMFVASIISSATLSRSTVPPAIVSSEYFKKGKIEGADIYRIILSDTLLYSEVEKIMPITLEKDSIPFYSFVIVTGDGVTLPDTLYPDKTYYVRVFGDEDQYKKWENKSNKAKH